MYRFDIGFHSLSGLEKLNELWKNLNRPNPVFVLHKSLMTAREFDGNFFGCQDGWDLKDVFE